MWFLFEEVSSSFWAWDGLRYFIVALPEPSISLIINQNLIAAGKHHVFFVCLDDVTLEKQMGNAKSS